ncbi:YheC/YheD family protein [Thermoactinomyces daqus]|uniref:YheC/YheD family protein n=1 Tax=Thermoactinomyces daqus TaxID=1329516 RepID=A0A7W1X8X0_9BACL|nr:YheC/YheD family protein [Thermoactinomyces daqus]MBA4542179.1 YheC/YheD family protein [Thermoactinomyces daqus]
MADTVGVLVSRHIFSDCIRDRTPYEVFPHYDQAARQVGLKPIFFTIEHVRLADRTVDGFTREPDGRYHQQRHPLPKVIHNRIKPAVFQMKYQLLRALPGLIIFNRDNRMDKWRVAQILEREPELKPHLPETFLYQQPVLQKMFDRFGACYIKPRNKSLGIGVCRLMHKNGAIWIEDAKGAKGEVPFNQLPAWIHKHIHAPVIVQQPISLLTINRRPVDFRVSVQKDGTGQWQVTGIVAKVGKENAVATNVAVGGKARRFDEVMVEAGFTKPASVREKMERVAVMAAKALEKSIPGMADLGLDLAIDEKGDIWIIEINGRDLRITFHQAGDLESWRRTFAAPMEYAAYLYRQPPAEKPGKPTVALITPGNLPVHGGKSGSVEIVARSWAKELGKNHHVLLLGNQVEEMADATALDLKAPVTQQYYKRVEQSLKFLKPDIIQVENRPLLLNRLAKAAPNAKKVLFVHSHTYLNPPYANRKALRKLLPRYDFILTNSRYMADCLKKEYPQIMHKLKEIWLGVDLHQFASIHDPSVRRRRIEERIRHQLNGRPVILYVGRIVPQKGLHLLIEAFKQVREVHPAAVLLIVGSSFYGRNVETGYLRKCRQLGREHGEQIRWWPHIPHQGLPAVYQLADVLVVPSVGKEAFGLVTVEGMATGLPILATQTGGIGELVENGVNGRLVSPGPGLSKRIAKVLVEWLNRPDQLKEMGKKSRIRAENYFGWSKGAKELSEIYHRLA